VDLSDDDVRRARARAQLLHRPRRRPAVVDLVSQLLAVQAQDIAAAPLALRARARELTAADVRAARADRSIVRAWGPRGTLHHVAAADLDWLTVLFGPLMVPGAVRRLKQEGVSAGPAEVVRAVGRATAGQGPLSKVDLGRRLAAVGVAAQGQAIVHCAGIAAAHGQLVLGPDTGGKPTYVHAEDWLGRPVDLTRDRTDALTELTHRYLTAHAPASPEDLATWSGLSLTDSRAGFAALGDRLVEVRHRHHPLWIPGRARPAQPVGLGLLPAFDEYLLGWRDRDLAVPADQMRAVCPGGGILHPVVLADGRVVGTWRRGSGERPTVTLAEPAAGAAGPDELAGGPDALAAEVDDVIRFLGR
jgi:hypothetical protein